MANGHREGHGDRGREEVSVDRLIEQGAATEAESELIGLIEACEPVSVSDLAKRRSLGAVYHRHHQRRRSTRFAMRLAMASGVLLVAGAATAAVFGVRWRARPESPAVVAHRRGPGASPRRARPARADRRGPAPPGDRRSPSRPRRGCITRVSSAPRIRRWSSRPSRRCGRIRIPRAPSRLLAAYLRTYPRGALVEEAVALSFEAADARKSPAAATFAQRYLRDYPQGRFRVGGRAGSGAARAVGRLRLVRRRALPYDRGRVRRARRAAVGLLLAACGLFAACGATPARGDATAARRPTTAWSSTSRRSPTAALPGTRSRFDGAKDYATAGDAGFPIALGPQTLEMWINSEQAVRDAGLSGPAHRLLERRAGRLSRRRARRLARLRRSGAGRRADDAAGRHLVPRRLQLRRNHAPALRRRRAGRLGDRAPPTIARRPRSGWGAPTARATCSRGRWTRCASGR